MTPKQFLTARITEPHWNFASCPVFETYATAMQHISAGKL